MDLDSRTFPMQKIKLDKNFVYIHTRIITKLNSLFKTFSKQFTNTFFSDKENNISDPAIKSPWITMDTKGANTFPLYNVPPEPKI